MSESAATMKEETQTLKERYQQLKLEQPGLRARNLAELLAISEAELLLMYDQGDVIRLKDQAEDILRQVIKLGEVMALTRNNHCVHERKGIYDNASFYSHGKFKQGLFVNPDIDLRLFMSQWSSSFAVIEQTSNGDRKSLQFFDKAGVAIHKIYLTPKSNSAAFDTLVKKYRAEDQDAAVDIEQYPIKPKDLPDSAIDWQGFRSAWEKLKDTHDFFPMLKKFKVGREQALRHVGDDFAHLVDNTASREVLQFARDLECEIMVFVGNRGCIQIHTGRVNKLVESNGWYNVLDPAFNLHLREDSIARTWVTRKPTSDGIVTALEVFDNDGELIVTFFGKRKPGIPELEMWREIIERIPAKGVRHVA